MNRFLATVALCFLGMSNAISQIGGPTGTGQWTAPIPFPLIPVSVANLPNGKVLVWSAEHTHAFGIGTDEHTETAIYDPVTKSIIQNTAGHAHHNMFCPGINNLPDGKILVTGGLSSKSSSLYDPVTNTWSAAADMNLGRGYQGAVTLNNGAAFLIGGSWSGGGAEKLAEVWTPTTGWSILPNIPLAQSIMDGANDPDGQYRNDNHAWMFTAPNGKIFHAGPSANMHWLSLANGGTTTLAKPRLSDGYAMQGICVMYEKGKLLKAGGSGSYSALTPANARTYTVDINQDNVVVTDVPDMKRARIFHNSVVLPNGEVFVVGGMDHAEPFSDAGSVLIPEIWNPANNTWRDVKAMVMPRNYHSVAILLQDGTVFVGGGGLCNDCATNHADAEIFSPSYLFKTDNTPATRPVITAAPTTANNSSNITVNTNGTVSYFSLIRMSSATHSTNNEQRYRRVPMSTVNSTTYNLTIENNSILVPGNYMLFAINSNGTPSLAKTIKIGAAAAVCTIKPEYNIDGVWKSGQVNLGVAAGKSMVLSALPDNANQTIKRPDGSTVTGDLNLGVLTPAQNGKYIITGGGCTTSLNLTVTNCTESSILPEYQINEVWTTGTPNQTLTIPRGSNTTLSAMPNEIEVAKITLPNGKEVLDNYGINPITPQYSGVYRFESVQGCATNLNVIVPCQVTPQYLLNGVWTNANASRILTLQTGNTVTIGIAEDEIPVTIKLPNGKYLPVDYTIASVSVADTGTYTFLTSEGCFATLSLRLGNCPASSIIPEYKLDGVWTPGFQNQELIVSPGKSLTLSMLPDISAPLSIRKPDGTTSGDQLLISSLGAQHSGKYTFTANGCSTTLNLKVNNCALAPLLPEYNVNGVWFSTVDGQHLNLAQGTPLTLSILPNGPGLTLLKPNGTFGADHDYIPSLSSIDAGIYTFISTDGCTAKLNISVGKCPKAAVIPEYTINNGPWLASEPNTTLPVATGSSFVLSMLPNFINVAIKRPDGVVVADNYNFVVNSGTKGIYTLTSAQNCSATVNIAFPGAREDEATVESHLESAEVSEVMTVYPNPFQQQIKVVWDGQKQYHMLSVLDFSGRVVHLQKLDANMSTLDLDLSKLELADGMYVIELQGSDRKYLSKVLLKNNK